MNQSPLSKHTITMQDIIDALKTRPPHEVDRYFNHLNEQVERILAKKKAKK